MNKTIDYYNTKAKEFYDRTINADVKSSCRVFLENLPPQAHILDAGCGVGRDSKYFLKEGYKVTAFDASMEMAKLASTETGLTVKNLYFHEMDFDQKFDGVWAQASLLHVPYNETRMIYQKIHRALKPGGVFYASYKYGGDYMPTSDRNFWNMNEQNILPYLDKLFTVINIWKECDKRNKVACSPNQVWLNFIVKKGV